jgi:uncharacterized membrane protein
MKPVELLAMVFAEENAAAAALEALKKLERERSLQLFSLAIIEKDHRGKVRCKESRDVDAGQGALFGALVGGLVGLLGGPAGVALGVAAGAATGGITAKQIDQDFSDQFLHELQSALHPGHSLLLVLVESTWVDRAVAELRRFEGTLLRHAVKAGLVDRLSQIQKEQSHS